MIEPRKLSGGASWPQSDREVAQRQAADLGLRHSQRTPKCQHGKVSLQDEPALSAGLEHLSSQGRNQLESSAIVHRPPMHDSAHVAPGQPAGRRNGRVATSAHRCGQDRLGLVSQQSRSSLDEFRAKHRGKPPGDAWRDTRHHRVRLPKRAGPAEQLQRPFAGEIDGGVKPGQAVAPGGALKVRLPAERSRSPKRRHQHSQTVKVQMGIHRRSAHQGEARIQHACQVLLQETVPR
jgi:hypothetical protein